MPTIPAEVVDRYRKVCGYATGGSTPNERSNANTIRAKLEAQYPGIAAVAARGAAPSPSPAHGGFTGRPPGAGGMDDLPPSWRSAAESVRDFLRGAMAEAEADDAATTVVADFVTVSSRIKDDGKLVVLVTINPEDVARVFRHMDAAGAERVAQRIGAEVAAEFTALVNAVRADDAPAQRHRGRGRGR